VKQQCNVGKEPTYHTI